MKKILIVEDDEKYAIALGMRLKANGYSVLVAYDALTGVTVANRQEPDLILLDVAMPVGGGFSVAERLHNSVTTAAIPIIFMTGSTDPDVRRRAIEEYGAAGFLEKPFETPDLLTAIKEALTPTVEATLS